MVHFMRHAAFCLWATLLIGGFGSFYVLPPLQAAAGLEAVPVLAAAFLAGLYAALRWAANRFATARARHLMRAGDLAEREGLRAEAEAAFQEAMALLDGFLVAPGARRRALPPLAARLARFYLSESRLDGGAADFIAGYLYAWPRDEEVAEQWVLHAEQRGGLREEHQDLAARLGEAHPRNRTIQRGLARLYLMLERTDYPALQSYRRACDPDGRAPEEICRGLARLLRSEGRSEEWAQRLYRQAALQPPAVSAAPDETARGFERPPAGADGLQMETPDAEEDVAADAAFRMSVADADEDEMERGALFRDAPRGRPEFVERLQVLAAAVGRKAVSAWGRLQAAGAAAVRRAVRIEGSRAVWAAAAILITAAAGLWVAAGLFSGPADAPPAPVPEAVVPAVVADPFTLQVAAYLKRDYALKFVEDLKRKGLDAYFTETASGGKLWYQVRISHFPDQQSAREYGRRLKDQNLIDDFYVANYVR
jgi:septal ring-binding cell division protein DamX